MQSQLLWRIGRFPREQPILRTGSSHWPGLQQKSMTALSPRHLTAVSLWNFPARNWLKENQTPLPFQTAGFAPPSRQEVTLPGILLPMRSSKTTAFVSLQHSVLMADTLWIRRRRFCVPWKHSTDRLFVFFACSATIPPNVSAHPSVRSRNISWLTKKCTTNVRIFVLPVVPYSERSLRKGRRWTITTSAWSNLV